MIKYQLSNVTTLNLYSFLAGIISYFNQPPELSFDSLGIMLSCLQFDYVFEGGIEGQVVKDV